MFRPMVALLMASACNEAVAQTNKFRLLFSKISAILNFFLNKIVIQTHSKKAFLQ